jgi:hypothetical protein
MLIIITIDPPKLRYPRCSSFRPFAFHHFSPIVLLFIRFWLVSMNHGKTRWLASRSSPHSYCCVYSIPVSQAPSFIQCGWVLSFCITTVHEYRSALLLKQHLCFVLFEVTLHLSTGISLESKRCFTLKVNNDVPDGFIVLIQEHGYFIVRYVLR